MISIATLIVYIVVCLSTINKEYINKINQQKEISGVKLVKIIMPSGIKQKGEFQDRGNKKTKHAKFSEKIVLVFLLLTLKIFHTFF